MRALFSVMLTVLYAVVVFSTSSIAGEKKSVPDERIVKRAFEVCPASLKSEIPGIVESTIYNLILIKKYYPAANYTSIVEKLNRVSEESADPVIRYKAHLASIYICFSNMIDVQPETDSYDREYLFKQTADQLESNLLVSK